MRLNGITVLLTRAAGSNTDLDRLLRERGASTVVLPSVAFKPPASWHDVDVAVKRLKAYDSIVFTSPRAVEFLLNRIDAITPDARRLLAARKIYAVGTATADPLRSAGCEDIAVPSRSSGRGLIDLLKGEDLQGRSFLVPQSNIGRDEVSAFLRNGGANVDTVVVYRTVNPTHAEIAPVRQALTSGAIHAAVFYSPSAVRGTIELLGTGPLRLLAHIAIGPTTAEALRSEGLVPTAVAADSTPSGVADAVERIFPHTPL